MDQECLRAIALGLRRPGEEANEDQWHTLRALATDALLNQHRANSARKAEGHALPTASEVAEAAYAECRVELQKIVTLSKRVAAARVQHNHARPHCVSAADASRPTDTWQQAWVDSGLANATTASQQILPARGAQAPATAPRNRPKAATPPVPLPANALVVYTDRELRGPESWWGRQTAGCCWG